MPSATHVTFLAIVLLFGCGDPLFDSSGRDVALVSTGSWWQKYGPNIAADVWFPELHLTIDPRIESSDTTVAKVELRRYHRFDHPVMRSVRIETGNFGSSSIRLYDGDELVREEDIHVVGVETVAFDYLDTRALRADIERRKTERPPQTLLIEPHDRLALLERFGTSGWLRLYDAFGDEVLAAVQPPSCCSGSLGLSGKTLFSDDTLGINGDYGTALRLTVPTVRGPERRDLEVPQISADEVDSIEIRSASTSIGYDGNPIVTIAVYGTAMARERGSNASVKHLVVGLASVVRVNGELLRSVEPVLDPRNYSWVFEYQTTPEDDKPAVIDATWRTLTATAQGPTP